MSRIGHLGRRYGFDAFVVVLTLAAIAEVVFRRDSANAPTTTLWFSLPALALMAAPLFARHRFPFAAPAAFWALAVAFSFVDGRLVTFARGTFVLGMAASFLLGNQRHPMKARIGLVVVLGGAETVVYNLPGRNAPELVFIPLLFVLGWLAGYAMHSREEQADAAEARAAQAEREREGAARIAVAEERARIARELHDVVAHSVSVMVLQVGAVRHKLPGSMEEELDALQGVERTGRAALAEMRRLLGAMRREGDEAELGPQPGLDSLDSLASEVEKAGLPVYVHVEGERIRLPQALDLSAYRIVQEGLTNALRYAHASRADVTVRYAPEELRIEVRDDGSGPAKSDGRGHGLVGVSERVKIYGGSMSAGSPPGGGFVLDARLPIAERAS